MAKYRKIDPGIWNDATFRNFSLDGQYAFLFILTHPHMTMLGAMRATIPGLAAELGWPPERLREALGEAFAKGRLKYDEKACFLWAPNFLKYNPPESPNVVKSWGNALTLLPECDLQVELLQAVKGFTEALPEAFRKALPEAFAKAMPNQEQEQEQEQKTTFTPPDQPAACIENSKTKEEPKADPDEFESMTIAAFGWNPQTLTNRDRDRIGVFAATLRTKQATPDILKAKIEAYRKQHPTCSCTPEAIAKHWDQLQARTTKQQSGGGTLAKIKAEQAKTLEERERNRAAINAIPADELSRLIPEAIQAMSATERGLNGDNRDPMKFPLQSHVLRLWQQEVTA